MKITVFGASGDVGRRVVAEALLRGHEVTAVARDAAKLEALPKGVRKCAADVAAPSAVARLTARQDVAISALRPPEGREDTLVPLTRAVLDGAADSGVRALIVGGAASLRMPDMNGTTVLTAPGFLPESVVPIARACAAQHALCRANERADWAYLSPPAMLTPGDRTGRYRLGSDTLLVDRDRQSRISMEDFAVALLDEAETPRHTRTRFTVAY